MTIEGENGPPTLERVARALRVSEEALDRDFGVILIDPKRELYAVRVDEEAVQNAGPERARGVHGPFSDPRIAPFGPPPRKPQR
jgi:hypothetical protein